jgi:iron(III) transport system substrate-binding protein
MQFLFMGSQEIYSRIAMEGSRPAADVWWGAPSSMFVQAAEDGLLEPYRPSWADGVSEEYRDPEDRWYATYLSPLAIVFNKNGHSKETAPKTWDELLEPKWHGKIALRRPLPSGTMRTFLCAMIARAPSEDEGIAWLQRLHAATAEYPETPGMLFDHLTRNPDRVSVWLFSDVVMQYVLHGYPFDANVPPQTPVLTDGIAIVKNAPHMERAKQFYEFVTTREALANQATRYAKFPARKDIPAEVLPPRLVEQAMDGMQIDWQYFAENEKAWCERWQREVFEAKPRE